MAKKKSPRKVDPVMPGQKFLTGPQVCERYGVAMSTLYKWLAEGKFPEPYVFANSTVRWSIEELEAFEKQTAKQREAVQPPEPAPTETTETTAAK